MLGQADVTLDIAIRLETGVELTAEGWECSKSGIGGRRCSGIGMKAYRRSIVSSLRLRFPDQRLIWLRFHR